MEEKKKSALRIIEIGLNRPGYPCIAWSGGKDSMALLHLVFKVAGAKIPVIFFREQWQPKKYAFQNRIIEEWGLEVYTWHPSKSAFQQTGNEFEVQNQYLFGGENKTPVTCPTGITPIEDGKEWICSLDILKRPKNLTGLESNWDLMFVGHKRCDGDPIYGGDAGTRVQLKINPGKCDAIYPIYNWSHNDVFNYCISEGVPIQHDRYEEVDGQWKERTDKTTNCDYVHACTACVDKRPDAPKFVHCPKYRMVVSNVSECVPWADQSIPEYMRD